MGANASLFKTRASSPQSFQPSVEEIKKHFPKVSVMNFLCRKEKNHSKLISVKG